MRRSMRLALVVALCGLAGSVLRAQTAPLMTADAANFMGTWLLTLDSPQGPFALTMALTDADGKVVCERRQTGCRVRHHGRAVHDVRGRRQEISRSAGRRLRRFGAASDGLEIPEGDVTSEAFRFFQPALQAPLRSLRSETTWWPRFCRDTDAVGIDAYCRACGL